MTESHHGYGGDLVGALRGLGCVVRTSGHKCQVAVCDRIESTFQVLRRNLDRVVGDMPGGYTPLLIFVNITNSCMLQLTCMQVTYIITMCSIYTQSTL